MTTHDAVTPCERHPDPAASRPPRWQVEWEICQIASRVVGVDRQDISPASRMIQDLHLDSLCLLEFILEVEEAFGVTIPHWGEGSEAAKRIFTRQPLLLRDFAELVLVQWGTGSPDRTAAGRVASGLAVAETPAPLPFLQLGGRLKATQWLEGELYEPLSEDGAGVRQYRRRTDGMRCIAVPPAEVLLGSDAPDADADERPVRRVRISPFLIDAEPVSALAYARFLNSLGRVHEGALGEWLVPAADDRRAAQLPLRRRMGTWRAVRGAERKPMVLVSWFGANAYALWANRRDWRAYRAEGDGGDTAAFLPSEAQWEYAAGGGKPQAVVGSACVGRHAHGTRYEDAADLPAADVNVPLGLSPLGLHHAAGNVWQWCRDWYSPDFPATPAANEVDPECRTPTGVRSERGGSWVGPARLARSAYRRGRPPEARGRCLGFRCVGSVEDLPKTDRTAPPVARLNDG